MEEEEDEVQKVSGRIKPLSLASSSLSPFVKSAKKEERTKIGNSEDKPKSIEGTVDEYLDEHARFNLLIFEINFL